MKKKLFKLSIFSKLCALVNRYQAGKLSVFSYMLLSCVLCSLFASCTGSKNDNKPTDNVLPFSLSDFQEVRLDSGITIPLDNTELLGIPTNIKVVNDSILAIIQAKTDTGVILYNLNSGAFQKAVNLDSGPLEMLYPNTLSTDTNGLLWISGSRDQKVFTAKWAPEGNEAIVESVMKSPTDVMRGVSDGKGGMIVLPAVLEDIRAIRFDSTGAVTDTIGTFPIFATDEPMEVNNLVFQSDIAYSAPKQKLIVAVKSWDEIDIYPLQGKGAITLKAPIDEQLEVKKRVMGDMAMAYVSPMWFMFSDVKTLPESFAVGYIGVKIEKEEDYDRQIGNILEFDYDGKPLRSYVPMQEAMTFDFDTKNRYLYTIENRPDPTLVRYSL